MIAYIVSKVNFWVYGLMQFIYKMVPVSLFQILSFFSTFCQFPNEFFNYFKVACRIYFIKKELGFMCESRVIYI